MHRKSANFSTLSELGRLPLHFDIVKDIFNYAYRLENLSTSFPLLKAAYLQSKVNYSNNIPSWYGTFSKITEMTNVDQGIFCSKRSIFKSQCKKTIYAHYLQEWNLIRLSQKGKLDTYAKTKTNFGFEKYLLFLTFEERKLICKLRTSAHNLEIERGRYMGIPRDQRFCKRCSQGVIEDEKHVLFECSAYSVCRENMMNIIKTTCCNFANLDNENKLLWVFNCENIEILSAVCKLIGQTISTHTVAVG